VSGFADLGSTTFTASASFTAVLGTDRGAVFGGGGAAMLAQRVFVEVRASRFRRTRVSVPRLGKRRRRLPHQARHRAMTTADPQTATSQVWQRRNAPWES